MSSSVLIVEYEQRSLDTLVRLFEARDCEVLTADHADLALSLCRQRNINLVVSRVVFRNGTSGIEFAAELRRSGIPVILFSPFSEAILRRLPGFPPADIPVVTDIRHRFGHLVAMAESMGIGRQDCGLERPASYS